ncbi:MAG: putative metal-binding motif-containing protein [Deltaproteobacteria bacterium]|nr:putative metal-binding motif-containing protein [Deltaproteobacteria bacterium]
MRPGSVSITLAFVFVFLFGSASGAGCGKQETPPAESTWYRDADSDTFGTPGDILTAATAPAGYVAQAGDCDDARADVHPGASELCNARDDNCDGESDEGLPLRPWYVDADLDGFGDPARMTEVCGPLPGAVSHGDDCDDADRAAHPGTRWYLDGDGDGYPVQEGAVEQCARPSAQHVAGEVVEGFDCDDGSGATHPFAPELLGNQRDDDCDAASPDHGSFTQIDFSGKYHVRGITTGRATAGEWSGTTRGTLSVNARGVIGDFEEHYSDSTTSTTSEIRRVFVGASGAVSTPDAPDLFGMIALDDRTVILTFSELDGGSAMFVLTRKGPPHENEDLVAPWSIHALAIGDPTSGRIGWVRGRLEIAEDGRGDGWIETRDGARGPDGIQASFDENHELRWVHGSADPESAFVMSDDGELIAGVSSVGGTRALALEVAVRSGGRHQRSDLAGDWTFHAVGTGEVGGASRNGHGSLRITPDGASEVVYEEWNRPGLVWTQGALDVDASGGLTHDALESFQGQLSRTGRLFVATYTAPDGSDVLLIGLRRRAPPALATLEPERAITRTVMAAGALLETTGGDGTIFQLSVPPGAIAGPGGAAITMTPISTMTHLPAVGAFLGGVHLAPEGLELELPATLTMVLPSGQVPSQATGIVLPGRGADRVRFHDASAGGSGGTLSLDLVHFSSAGAIAGSTADQTDTDSAYFDVVSSIVLAAIARGVEDADELAALIAPTMLEWLERSLLPTIDHATSLGDLAQDATASIGRWEGVWQLLGFGEDTSELCLRFEETAERIEERLKLRAQQLLEVLDSSCIAESAPCTKLDYLAELLWWNGSIQSSLNAISCFDFAPESPCGHCGGAFRTLPTRIVLTPMVSDLRIGERVDFQTRAYATSSCNPDPVAHGVGLTADDSSVISLSGSSATAVDWGCSLVFAVPTEMESCLSDVSVVCVYGMEVFMVTVHDMVTTSGHPICRQVEPPSPLLYRMRIREDGTVRWERFAGSAESGYGVRQGAQYVIDAIADNPYYPIEKIKRHYVLTGGSEGMTGYYEWGWTGDFDSSAQQYTGCHGYSHITLTPTDY